MLSAEFVEQLAEGFELFAAGFVHVNVEIAIDAFAGGFQQFESVGFDGDGFESGRGKEFLFRQTRNPLILLEIAALLPPELIGFDDSDHFVTVRETAEGRHLF